MTKKNVMTMPATALLLSVSMLFTNCTGNKKNYDASGSFEATEVMVPAQANGVIEVFDAREGEVLDSGVQVGYIDTTELYLKKKQLEAEIKATGARLPDIEAQTAQYRQQAAAIQSKIDYLRKEQIRIRNLVKADAATPRQLDEINAQVEEAQHQVQAIHQQADAAISALKTQHSGISSEISPLYIQVQQVNEQLAKSKIINTVHGTVLTRFAEQGEMASVGKPLYSIADLSVIILRAYLTEDQFSAIKLGQTVTVQVDADQGKMKSYDGTISWISDKAEFTPKTVETKDERANLVYAVKIRVKNDGYLKIGMYGEVVFNTKS